MSNASLSFLPWVRQGAASAITATDSLKSSQSAVATVAPVVTMNGALVPGISAQLRGPADVIGIDANQIVRTDPLPGTIDFEPNCFPSIEFDRPDFPWLFTPAKANANNRLRPWLCLVVVRKQAGVTLTSPTGAPLATLTIAAPAQPVAELPDLTDSWAWAHAQVAADASTQPALDTAFAGGPELTLSRLVCPRILAPDTDYIACVVPTFELGRRAGLGTPILGTDLTQVLLAPAWVLSSLPAQVVLPVFHHWEFRTSETGDFESLASRLTPSVPDGLGRRPIDISQPGFPASGATTVELEGALLPIPRVNSPPPVPDPIGLEFRRTLASIVNEPPPVPADDPTEPLLAPPLYGRWHAGKAAAQPMGTSWLDQLNLDPRWRVAAAFGTHVVQEHQEALMASAWEQAAELPTANQRMRQMQLSMAVGQVLHKRHFSVLTDEMVLRIGAPAFGRLQKSPGRSLLASQTGTRLPVAANRSAMRRIGRQRGPLTRRIAAKGFVRSPTDTWVARLNQMSATTPPPPPPPPRFEYASMPPLLLATQRIAGDQSYFGAFFVAPENAPVTRPGAPLLNAIRTEVPDFFRTAARDHLDHFFPARTTAPSPNFTVYQSVRQLVLDQMDPRVALPPLVNAIISTGQGVLAPTAPGITPLGVETVMAAPHFPQPMYEPLRDLSQDLLLPGLDKVSPDTVVGLQTNRRFVEAYLVGLNHEMGRELLWRGYPTDQRGTYFDHFWGHGVPNVAPSDITDLNTWAERKLGDSVGAPPNAEKFVMLLRSSLLRRYPNAVIYLTPAIKAGAGAPDPDALVPDLNPANEQPPIFSGSLPPDVSFFGFPVTTDAAIARDGGFGYYVIIQEHPTEPRFGIDAGVSVAPATHLVIGANPPQGLDLNGGRWNTNAAEMARITRRLPVRMAIHASRLIASA